MKYDCNMNVCRLVTASRLRSPCIPLGLGADGGAVRVSAITLAVMVVVDTIVLKTVHERTSSHSWMLRTRRQIFVWVRWTGTHAFGTSLGVLAVFRDIGIHAAVGVVCVCLHHGVVSRPRTKKRARMLIDKGLSESARAPQSLVPS